VRRIWLVAIIFLLTTAGFLGQTCHAFSTNDLTIIQIKMTGSETLVIENTSSSSLNLSNYSVEYFNKSLPTSFTAPTSLQQLPSLNLGARQAILITGDSSSACGAAIISNETFTMSDTAGYIMVAKTISQSDGSLLTAPQDHVSWTSATSGADLTRVPSNTSDPNAVWYRKLADGTWQQADLNGDCTSLSNLISGASTTTFVDWADGDAAPSTIINLAGDTSGPIIPASDYGLASPQITELLPNPASPQTDSEDEFIEIYNPNNSDFDLSGFKIQIGTTTKHTYTIPAGTTIGGLSFRAFFSVDTNLAMSNSGGQAVLQDPLGTVLYQTGVYGSAKEGQAWALAKGSWYWTGHSTPNAANVIEQSGSSKSTKSSNSTPSVKGLSTSSTALPASSATVAPQAATIHPWTIAGVGTAALLYAGYEYRVDLANNLYRLRRYVGSRRNSGR
jgi:hypothetical protein